jgi:CRP-like cAMP-binding protein
MASQNLDDAEAVLGRHVHPRRDQPRPTGRDKAVHAIDPGPLSNKLLAALPRDDYHFVVPHLASVQLAQGTVLCEPGAEVNQVYFPLSGMISMVVVMRDGKAIETATVGREGVCGAMSGFGVHISRVRSIIQLPTFASRIASTELKRGVAVSKPIADLCLRYNEMLLTQARVTAACNALHQVEARFCRWLLQTRDRAESDTLPLTQEFLAEMLGVRRTSVTEVASKIQATGAIRYSRGIIKVIDLGALKAMSCECYETLRERNGH